MRRKQRKSAIDNYSPVQYSTLMSNGLSQRYVKVLSLRNDKKLKFDEIGKILGVSRQRAYQIYARAVRSLKKAKRQQSIAAA